jgi:hypothetical protein
MAYTLANLENDIRNYTEVDSTELVLLFLILLLKMQKTKFIEK